MARRVGFGDGGEKRQAPSEPPPGPQPAQAPQRRPLNLRFRTPVPRTLFRGQARPVVWVVLAFLGFWLVAWTAGILFALGQVLGSPDAEPFLYLWLAFALIGEAVAVWVMINILQGLRAAPEKPE